MHSIKVLLIMLTLSVPASAHKWSDAKGKHSIEAEFVEAKVTVRLPDGQTKVVDMRQLSSTDQEYVLKQLHGEDAKANDRKAPQQPGQSLDALIASEDEIFGQVQGHHCYRFSSKVQIAEEWRYRSKYRDAVRALAEFYGKEQRVTQVFDGRLARLKSAPNPNDRAVAAYQLSGAMAISDTAIPALQLAATEDASGDVQLAAMLSLGGFGSKAVAAVPIIVDGYEERDADEDTKEHFQTERFQLLLALAQIQSDCPQLRKIVLKVFDKLKAGRRVFSWDLEPACGTLEMIGIDGKWAVPQLLTAAQASLAGKLGVDSGLYFNRDLSPALVSIGKADARVLAFYERAAKEGPAEYRVECDTAAKELRAQMKP